MSDNPAFPERAAVVLDPHPLCQEGIQAILEPLGVAVVGKALAVEPALALLEEHQPGVFVTETNVGDDGGVRYIRRAHEVVRGLTVIVVTANDDAGCVNRAFAAGAAAYVLKTAQPHEIEAAIREACEESLAPAVRLDGGSHLRDVSSGRAPVGVRTRVRRPVGLVPRLTRREGEILRLVAEGRSNGQVAKLLWVTDQTVKFHLANVYRKLGVSNRFEAAEWARANGLLGPVAVPVPAPASETLGLLAARPGLIASGAEG